MEQTAAVVRIERYRPEFRRAFYDLNVAWLRALFLIEPIDERILSDPEGEILAHGGVVLFAVLDDEAVGTCALKQHADGVFELTKMSVAPSHRELGIGELLIRAAVAEFHERAGRTLFLESSTKLPNALRLYARLGFVLQPESRRPGSEYARSDVYMIYTPSSEAGRPAQ
ncbi:MAG: GNAT family N-acetyltransferase [Polyangiales bacterium]